MACKTTKGFPAMMKTKITPFVFLGLFLAMSCGSSSGKSRSADEIDKDSPLGQANTLREEGMKKEVDGNVDGALEYYLAADEQYDKVGDKKNQDWGLINFYMGLIYRQKHDDRSAVDRFGKALEIIKASFGPDHSRVAEVLNYKGAAHKNLGEKEQALECFKKALEIREKESPPDENQIKILKMNINDIRDGW